MKKYSYLLLQLILAGLIISSCTEANHAAPTQSQDCSSPAEWKIDFTRSGGIAGLSQLVAISSNGSVIVQDLQKEEIHESTISPSEVKKIAAMLVQACPFEVKRSNNGCADCFEYTLKVFMDGRRYSWESNDINIPKTLGPLIGYLGSYITK